MIDTQEQMTTQEEAAPELIETDNEDALRALILNAEDIQEEIVTVPRWKTQILVRGMTGAQRAECLLLSRKKIDGGYDASSMFDIAQMCCVHPKTRQPIFKVADRDTVMGTKNGVIIEELGTIALNLSAANGLVLRKNS